MSAADPAPPSGPAQKVIGRRFASVPNGPDIAFVEMGSGPDLVLIHGTLVTLEDMWLGPARPLSQHFRVVLVDRPGHGASVRPCLQGASVWHQAEALRAAMAVIGVERPVVVGHSFGGAVALAWGMAAPEAVRGIVALAPICFPEPRLEQVLFGPRATPVAGDLLAPALNATADRLMLPLLWRAMFLPQAMPADFAARFPFDLAGRSTQVIRDGEDAIALWPDLTRSALAYPSCRAPVHLLCGGADVVVNPFVHGRRAADLLPGAEFRWLPGIGHMLHHFRIAEVVSAARALAEA